VKEPESVLDKTIETITK